ncbi:heme exporter protein CcmD [Dongia soli]|uniref:heme exporter protein CcmD n=1 Tax=Dongia soli TaxID=600628 RepID=UPI00360C627F
MMGGYADAVWPAYGVAVLMVAVFAVDSWRRLRRAAAHLHRLEAEGAGQTPPHRRRTAVARSRDHLRSGQAASDQRTGS